MRTEISIYSKALYLHIYTKNLYLLGEYNKITEIPPPLPLTGSPLRWTSVYSTPRLSSPHPPLPQQPNSADNSFVCSAECSDIYTCNSEHSLICHYFLKLWNICCILYFPGRKSKVMVNRERLLKFWLIMFTPYQWTYCLGASVAGGAATWFYFLTQPTKQLIYVPLVLTGVSSSAMNVMALSFIADVIKDDKVCMTSSNMTPHSIPSLLYPHLQTSTQSRPHSFFNPESEWYKSYRFINLKTYV